MHAATPRPDPMVRLHIQDHIASRSAERGRSYVDDMLSHGTVKGEWLELEDDVYRALLVKYRGKDGSKPKDRSLWLLGDLIEWLASPLKERLRQRGLWPKECGCEKRRQRLNDWCKKYPGRYAFL